MESPGGLFVHSESESETENEVRALDKDEKYGEIEQDDMQHRNHNNNGKSVTDTRDQPLGVSSTLKLGFQIAIVEEMLKEDSVLILGKGLGLEIIVANLLHILSASTTVSKTNKRSLVMLLNATDVENEKISDEFLDLTWNDMYVNKQRRQRQFAIIGGETVTSDKRRKIYEEGGVVSLSNQVLLLDLLNKIVDPLLITGIIVLHAERTSELSNDAFIIDIYRKANRWGFVKAVSEKPEEFTYGFSNLANKLKYLKLERVNLWPRFHVDVLTTLAPSQRRSGKLKIKSHNLINEVKVYMTESMKQIQTAILTAAKLSISQIRNRNPEVATDYWSIDNFPERNFMRSLRSVLDPVWHRVGDSTKQCMSDLSMLKELMFYLFSYDALKFNQLLQDFVTKDKHSSVSRRSNWLLSPETGMPCIEASLDRTGHDKREVEEMPKWSQLAKILQEIYLDKQDRDDSEDGPILILCSSYSVSNQLKMYLSTCERTKVGDRYYFSAKKMFKQLKRLYSPSEIASRIQLQQRIAEYEKARLKATDTQESTKSLRTGQPITKRRRTRGGSAVGSTGRSVAPNSEQEVERDISVDPEEPDNGKNLENGNDNDDEENLDLNDFMNDIGMGDFEDYDSEFLGMGGSNTAAFNRKDEILIEVFTDDSNDTLLQELQPSYIVAYEPNLTFFRRVEIYQASRKMNPATVYSMVYLDSIEEQIFLLETKKEKDSFTKLVRDKAVMAQHFSTESDNNKFQINRNKVLNTRIAGGSDHFGSAADQQVVVIDTREFRSSLPYVCHQMGMKVVPCMISVGDYIISPNICVERKSIPDLVSSLKSGRLYQQCENMFRFYRTPTLLIEFQEGKSFSFAPFVDARPAKLQEYSQGFLNDIQTKLVMLLIAFPKLKIIWSSSVYQTAQIFLELKSNQPQPDPEEALSKGDLTEGGSLYNDAAIDLLRHIPGITYTNYHLIINKVSSIRELSLMKEDQIAALIGNEAATKVCNFFSENVNTV